MDEPSHHLLRTFASVPLRSRVLDLGCGRGVHTIPLFTLGFDVYACDTDEMAIAAIKAEAEHVMGSGEAGRHISAVQSLGALGYADDFYDWVIVYGLSRAASTREDMVEVLREVRRVLVPGGWVYIAVDAVPSGFNPNEETAGYAGDSGPYFRFTVDALNELAAEAGLQIAEPPVYRDAGRPCLEGIYRRVDAGTAL